MHSYLVVAHRGVHDQVPENTIASFKAALRLGVDMIELDVRLTRDGTAVVFHDEIIEDLEGRSHKIASLDFTDLKRIHQEKLNTSGSSDDLHIPTLGEVVKIILPKIALNVELKPEKGREDLLIQRITQIILPHHDSKIIFSSFSKKILEELASLRRNFRVGCLFRRAGHYNLMWARRNGCYSIHPKSTLCKHSLIHSAHEDGLRVIVWTVNETRKMDQFLNWKVDGIITDKPKALLRLRKGYPPDK